MDHFKANGDLTLELPLAPGFEKLFQDFLRITLSKSGFAESESSQIAEKVFESLRAKIVANEDRPEVEIVVSHRPGNVHIRTRIEVLNIAEEHPVHGTLTEDSPMSIQLDAFLSHELHELHEKGLYRRLRILEGQQLPQARFDGRMVVNLSSNNYLGLNTHPALVRAAIEATERFGVGSGAVRSIAGTMKTPHRAGKTNCSI